MRCMLPALLAVMSGAITPSRSCICYPTQDAFAWSSVFSFESSMMDYGEDTIMVRIPKRPSERQLKARPPRRRNMSVKLVYGVCIQIGLPATRQPKVAWRFNMRRTQAHVGYTGHPGSLEGGVESTSKPGSCALNCVAGDALSTYGEALNPQASQACEVNLLHTGPAMFGMVDQQLAWSPHQCQSCVQSV